MRRCNRHVWIVASLCVVSGALSADQEPIVVAEFRADLDAQTTRPVLSQHWAADLYSPTDTQTVPPWRRQTAPAVGRELGGSVRHPLWLGSRPLSAIVDYRYQQWGLSPNTHSQSFVIGPQISLTAASTTRIYYGVSRDSMLGDDWRLSLGTNSELSRTGLAQTWYITEREAEVQLGYEFEQGSSEEIYDYVEGHRVNVRGRFPLGEGVDASVAARYSRLSYPEYNGLQDLQSDRLSFRAGINRSFSKRLTGSLHFTYANEDFEDTPVSYLRHAWGLNLKYEY